MEEMGIQITLGNHVCFGPICIDIWNHASGVVLVNGNLINDSYCWWRVWC